MSLAPSTVGAPLIPDALNGIGTAITFTVFGEGESLEGGAYEWNDVCGECWMRLSVASGDFVVSDATNAATLLAPGVYELREYRGLFLSTQREDRSFDVELHGAGKIIRLG